MALLFLYIKTSTYNKYGKLKEIIQFYKIGSFKTRHKVQFLYIKSYWNNSKQKVGLNWIEKCWSYCRNICVPHGIPHYVVSTLFEGLGPLLSSMVPASVAILKFNTNSKILFITLGCIVWLSVHLLVMLWSFNFITWRKDQM